MIRSFNIFGFGFVLDRMCKRNEELVDVTPGPMLSRLERGHNWVALFVKMLSGMPIHRGVAAADMTAAQTKTQMHPLVIVLYAFLTAILTPGFVNTSFAGVLAG